MSQNGTMWSRKNFVKSFLKTELMFRKKLQNKNISTVIINKVYKIEVIYKTFSLKNKLK